MVLSFKMTVKPSITLSIRPDLVCLSAEKSGVATFTGAGSLVSCAETG